MDKKEIKQLIEQNEIEFIRLQFTDIFGVLKNVAVSVDQLDKALDNKCMMDGSSIEGFARIEESDMYLRPDAETFLIFPERINQGRAARFICDVYKPDGTPFEGDPRYILRRAIDRAQKMGYDVNIGPECEFFLFNTKKDGRPTVKTHDVGGYFDLGPIDSGEAARRDMSSCLMQMGFEIEGSHHETAGGQHEIDFKYAHALKAADNIMTFKLVVKAIAQNHKLYATFMPKPLYGRAGSGMHVNISMSGKNGYNVFYDPLEEQLLSREAYMFIGGLLQHARAMCCITNPLVNSYKRLIAGFEAPVYVAWSPSNRSPLIRVPAAREMGTRVELRNPDPAANPYLTLALAISAGLDGIQNQYMPPPPVDSNIYELTEEDRIEKNIDNLPTNLSEAVRAMRGSEFMRETLGDHVFNKYILAKRAEWNDYKSRVTRWELEQYLYKY